MKPQEVEQIEVDLLLEALYRRYGYDSAHTLVRPSNEG